MSRQVLSLKQACSLVVSFASLQYFMAEAKYTVDLEEAKDYFHTSRAAAASANDSIAGSDGRLISKHTGAILNSSQVPMEFLKKKILNHLHKAHDKRTTSSWLNRTRWPAHSRDHHAVSRNSDCVGASDENPQDPRPHVDVVPAPWDDPRICKVFSVYDQGIAECSGTLVGPFHFVTARHCSFSGCNGEAAEVYVACGYGYTPDAINNDYAHFGYAKTTFCSRDADYDNAAYCDDTGAEISAASDLDYQLCALDRPLGEVLGWFGATSNTQTAVNVKGYPGEAFINSYISYGTEKQFHRYHDVSSTTDYRYFMNGMWAFKGESGGPYYRYEAENNARYVSAVHRGGATGCLEEGVRITSSRLAELVDKLDSWDRPDDYCQIIIYKSDVFNHYSNPIKGVGRTSPIFSESAQDYGGTFAASVTLFNTGTSTGSATILWYASRNNLFTKLFDIFLGETTIYIPASSTSQVVESSLPVAWEGESYYIGAFLETDCFSDVLDDLAVIVGRISSISPSTPGPTSRPTSGSSASPFCLDCVQGSLNPGDVVTGDTRVPGTSVLGRSSCDHIWYVELSAAGTYVFDTCGSSFDTHLTLYQRDPTSLCPYGYCQLYSCDDCGDCGTRAIIEYTFDTAGSYAILVEGYSGCGSYTLSMTPTYEPTYAPTPISSAHCVDSTSWFKKNDPLKNCEWVASFTPNRCGTKGDDGTPAFEQCPEACDTCQYTCDSEDSTTWFRSGDSSRDCEWVSAFYGPRCPRVNDQGVYAFEACPYACRVCHHCDNDNFWTINNQPTKNCDWVALASPSRCTKPGTDSNGDYTYAYQSCPNSCRVCPSYGECSDDAGWLKQNEVDNFKNCDWVASSPDSRCLVKGTDSSGTETVAYQSCRVACSTC